MNYLNAQQVIDNDDNLNIFNYYKKYGLVLTCEKFRISEERLFQMIVARYGEACNDIISDQFKSAIRNLFGS